MRRPSLGKPASCRSGRIAACSCCENTQQAQIMCCTCSNSCAAAPEIFPVKKGALYIYDDTSQDDDAVESSASSNE
jgi:hypothetical protein